jgi:ABC-type cobalamin/Fe3+-siderophores transport system ATPase subunit
MTPTISVTGLTRRYYDEVALDDVSLTVGAGTITELLGCNGAGKTTPLRILAGQEFPSSGSVRVFGAAPAENEDVLRRLVLVSEDQAYPDFKVCHALHGRRPRHDPPRHGVSEPRPLMPVVGAARTAVLPTPVTGDQLSWAQRRPGR